VPFATIQRSLQTGQLTDREWPTLVRDVNAEANAITAVVCRVDGGMPQSVCSRPVIRFMLQHLR
jgi:hypothetical protein